MATNNANKDKAIEAKLGELTALCGVPFTLRHDQAKGRLHIVAHLADGTTGEVYGVDDGRAQLAWDWGVKWTSCIERGVSTPERFVKAMHRVITDPDL